MMQPSGYQAWNGSIVRPDYSFTPSGSPKFRFQIKYPYRERVEDEDTPGEYIWANRHRWSPFIVAWGGLAKMLGEKESEGMLVSVITNHKRNKGNDGEWYDNFTVDHLTVLNWHTDGSSETFEGDSEPQPQPQQQQDDAAFDATAEVPF